jgi:hypothetical protein
MGLMTPDVLLAELMRRCPTLDRIAAYRLSEAWATIHNQIIDRMFDIVEHEMGLVLHVDQRAESISELAKFSLFLQQRILDDKAKAKPLDQYDPAAEAALLKDAGEQNKIENTARNAADGLWKPLTAKWRARRPSIEATQKSKGPAKLWKRTKTHFRRKMHYVPQSTTRQWADETSGKFVVYTIGIDGEIRARSSPAKSWGVAEFLYTQPLEHLLGLIEGDARRAYEKLVDIVALDDADTRHWIAFVIAQYIRTPRFIRSMLPKQEVVIKQSGIRYPTDPAHLGRALETLFQNNDLYATFYRLITPRMWSVVSAAAGLTFLKGDNAVVITGSEPAGTWRLLYPLTPRRCFVAGPELETEPGRIIPAQQLLGDEATIALNAAICAYAEASVIGVSTPDRIDPRPTMKAHLKNRSSGDNSDMPFWGLSGIVPDKAPSPRPRRR